MQLWLFRRQHRYVHQLDNSALSFPSDVGLTRRLRYTICSCWNRNERPRLRNRLKQRFRNVCRNRGQCRLVAFPRKPSTFRAHYFGTFDAGHRPLQLLLTGSRSARPVGSDYCPQHRWYSASWLQQRTNDCRTKRLSDEPRQFHATMSVFSKNELHLTPYNKFSAIILNKFENNLQRWLTLEMS